MDTRRTCTKCGREFPATLDYFYKQSSGLYGLNSRCKACHCESTRESALARNPETNREYQARHREAHREQLNERARQRRAENPQVHRERDRRYRERHPEKAKETQRESKRKARRINPDKFRVYDRAYSKTPKGRLNDSVVGHIKRARKRALPHDFTVADWQYCLNYWNHRCCICGKTQGFWHAISQDHWIPITDKRPNNPGTVPGNILPMCHALKDGEDCCNSNKKNKDPIQWLTERVGSAKAAKILKKINEYFATVRK